VSAQVELVEEFRSRNFGRGVTATLALRPAQLSHQGSRAAFQSSHESMSDDQECVLISRYNIQFVYGCYRCTSKHIATSKWHYIHANAMGNHARAGQVKQRWISMGIIIRNDGAWLSPIRR
jgi:hypothetical protein